VIIKQWWKPVEAFFKITSWNAPRVESVKSQKGNTVVALTETGNVYPSQTDYRWSIELNSTQFNIHTRIVRNAITANSRWAWRRKWPIKYLPGAVCFLRKEYLIFRETPYCFTSSEPAYCLHIQHWRWRQNVSPKRWHLPTSLYGTKTRKIIIIIIIIAAVKTSNLTNCTHEVFTSVKFTRVNCHRNVKTRPIGKKSRRHHSLLLPCFFSYTLLFILMSLRGPQANSSCDRHFLNQLQKKYALEKLIVAQLVKNNLNTDLSGHPTVHF
jgi:hypothetical protein